MQIDLFSMEAVKENCRCCRKRPVQNGKVCSVCHEKCVLPGKLKTKPSKVIFHDSQIEINLLCQKHNVTLSYQWFRAIENRQSGLRQRAKHKGFTKWATRADLKKLLIKQGLRCAYTGRQLSADNVRLAHRVPASRGGSFEADNLVWVSNEVNREMGTMTEAEYLLSKI